MAAGSKAIDESALFARDLWAEVRTEVLRVVMPLFREAYLAGAVLGSGTEPSTRERKPGNFALLASFRERAAKQVGFEPEDIDQVMPLYLDDAAAAADRVVLEYTDDWYRQFETSTQNSIRASVQRANAAGLGPRAVADDLASLFGPTRARRIAVSEMTNLMGMGAQETYRRNGFGEWEWRTARDQRVDQICRDLDRQTFPMTTRFRRAHVNCRCWPVPAGDPQPSLLFGGALGP